MSRDFIEVCEKIFDAMELGGNEVAESGGFDGIDVNDLVKKGRKELKVFEENGLDEDFLLTDDGDDFEILQSICISFLTIDFLETIEKNWGL